VASTDASPSGRGPVLKIRTKSATVEDFITRHARDFGVTGVFVTMRKPLDVGAGVGVEFQLVDGRPVFTAKGLVAWRREATRDSNLEPGMGLAFTKLEGDAAELLSRIAERRGGAPSRFDEPNAAPVAPRPPPPARGAKGRPARGLWSAANATPKPLAPAALRPSDLFSKPPPEPDGAGRVAVMPVTPVGIEEPADVVEAPEAHLETDPEWDAVSEEDEALELPDLPAWDEEEIIEPRRTSDPARAERFSRLISAIRMVSMPPDEPTPYGAPLLVALVLAFVFIGFCVYLFGTGILSPLTDTLVRGLRSLLRYLGLEV
jgi:hypothetical protein